MFPASLHLKQANEVERVGREKGEGREGRRTLSHTSLEVTQITFTYIGQNYSCSQPNSRDAGKYKGACRYY